MYLSKFYLYKSERGNGFYMDDYVYRLDFIKKDKYHENI